MSCGIFVPCFTGTPRDCLSAWAAPLLLPVWISCSLSPRCFLGSCLKQMDNSLHQGLACASPKLKLGINQFLSLTLSVGYAHCVSISQLWLHLQQELCWFSCGSSPLQTHSLVIPGDALKHLSQFGLTLAPTLNVPSGDEASRKQTYLNAY